MTNKGKTHFIKLILSIATQIRKTGVAKTFDAELLSGTADKLIGGLLKGYGAKAVNVRYNTADMQMINNLRHNVYQFAAAKNYQQLKDITLALINDNKGNELRTEREFFDTIKAMNIKYNRTWLSTERDTAIASGQMASRWVGFEKHKEMMPMLRYSTVGDGKVRPSHSALGGVVKHIDDPFWEQWYPPNGFRCRCDVMQLPDATEKPTQEFTVPLDIDPMFKTNLAKTGLIYPQNHPYFNGVPKAELRKAMAYLPAKNSYNTVKSDTDKDISLHLLHNSHEINNNLSIANSLLRLGYKDIKLLPDLHQKEALLKPRYYPKNYKAHDIRKNPDAWIKDKKGRNMVCDFKTLTGERSFAKRISQAAMQSNYAVIKIMCERRKLGIDNISKIVETKLLLHTALKGVIVLDETGALIFIKLR